MMRLRRNSKRVLTAISASIVVGVLLFVSLRKETICAIETSQPLVLSQRIQHKNLSTTLKNNIDIAINGYLRSGSSFLGELLGYREDTFYWYEPLWNFNSGVFYWGPDRVCPHGPHEELCGESEALRVKDKRCVARNMQDVLINIYMCNFTSLGPAVAETMTPEYSGDSWNPFVACRENTESTVSECLLELEKDCIESKHLATKVVRLTLDSYARVLEHLPNLRLVHLFRDPRAVINSRQTTTWYHLHNELSTVQDARELCNRMLYDIEYSVNLTERFPDRFLTVMFEDLRDNLPEKSKILYQYFGLSTDGLEDKLASMSPIKQNEKTIMAEDGDYSGWWRKRLPYSTVELVQHACADVMDVLGYRHFSSESEQLNMDISAFKFSAELTLQMETVLNTFRGKDPAT